jgi:putative transposase
MAPNELWSMEFVSDALFDGRRLRALTVVDAFTREALAIDVDQGIKGEQVVEAMNRITSIRGALGLFEWIMARSSWFLSLADARAKIEAWQRDYDECRPHTSLGWMTPAGFASSAGANPGR